MNAETFPSLHEPWLVEDSSATEASNPKRRLAPSFTFFWRTGTLLLVLAAFGALFSTREISSSIAVAFFSIWLLAVFVQRPPAFWRPWMSTALTLVAVYWLAQSALTQYFANVLNLLLFLVLFKCFTLRTARDHVQAQILCFFLVLAAAVVTVNISFSLFFPLYVLLAVGGLILNSIGVRLESATMRGGSGSDADGISQKRYGPLRIAAISAMLAVITLGLTAMLFLLFPHYSLRKLDAPLSRRRPQATVASSGFSEDVRLGDFKSIQPDPTTVMLVEVVDGQGRVPKDLPHLRLRGIALDNFQNNRWRRIRSEVPGQNILRQPLLFPEIATPQTGRQLIQKIYQDPDITTRLFAASFPVQFQFEKTLRVRADPKMGTYQVADFGRGGSSGYTNPFVYQAASNYVEEATDDLIEVIKGAEESQRTLVPEVRISARARMSYLQLPQTESTRRIRALARQVAPGPSRPEIVVQAANYLRGNYEYTLDPNTPDGADAMESFLFDTKRGHCEYFASSLVLMLRARGIPARLVNGYFTQEWNDLAKVFVVKQSDAHSWAEVWLNGMGWLTIDPTPPSLAGSGAYGAVRTLPGRPLWDYAQIVWRRWVIDYSPRSQARVYRNVRELSSIDNAAALVSRLRDRLRGRGSQAAIDRTDPVPIPFLLIFTALAVVGGLAWRLIAARRGVPGEPRSSVPYFNDLMERLENLGAKRSPEQTPMEFVRNIEDPVVQAVGADWVVDLYYRERFASEEPSAPDLVRVRRILAEIGRGQAADAGPNPA